MVLSDDFDWEFICAARVECKEYTASKRSGVLDRRKISIHAFVLLQLAVHQYASSDCGSLLLCRESTIVERIAMQCAIERRFVVISRP